MGASRFRKPSLVLSKPLEEPLLYFFVNYQKEVQEFEKLVQLLACKICLRKVEEEL